MSDPAAVLLSNHRCEGHVLGQMEVPALFEGQVGLVGVGKLHFILHQLDLDVRRVEAAHVADQDVFLPVLSRFIAVHLHLRGNMFGVLCTGDGYQSR